MYCICQQTVYIEKWSDVQYLNLISCNIPLYIIFMSTEYYNNNNSDRKKNE